MKIQGSIFLAAFTFTMALWSAPAAHASIAKGARNLGVETNKNLVLWCGAGSALEQSRFPYLAAIRNYRSHKGQNFEVATIYKKGKVVFRQYVYHDAQRRQDKYQASGDEFTLSLKGRGHRAADLKAVVHDEDGVKMIAAGSLPCAKPKHG